MLPVVGIDKPFSPLDQPPIHQGPHVANFFFLQSPYRRSGLAHFPSGGRTLLCPVDCDGADFRQYLRWAFCNERYRPGSNDVQQCGPLRSIFERPILQLQLQCKCSNRNRVGARLRRCACFIKRSRWRRKCQRAGSMERHDHDYIQHASQWNAGLVSCHDRVAPNDYGHATGRSRFGKRDWSVWLEFD